MTRSPGRLGPPGQAVILCGGLGTRLGALTAETPKPLLPVGKRPFLDILLFELGRHGVRRALLLAAFHADKIARYAHDNPVAKRFGISLEVSVEPDQAGTGGALWHARGRLDDRFFLLNGDSWFDFNLLALSAHRCGKSEATVVMALRALTDASRYGAATLDGDRVTRFAERPDAAGPGLVNAGVYLMRRELVEACSPSCSLERDVLPGLVDCARVQAIVRSGYFIDIGVPQTFAAAQTDVPAQQRKPAIFLDRNCAMNLDNGLQWINGAHAAIRRFNEAGLYVFLVDSQVGAAHGGFDEQLLERTAERDLAAGGAHVDDTVRRKPVQTILRDLMLRWPVDKPRSLMIAETEVGAQAARAAGLSGVLFSGGKLSDYLLDGEGTR